MTAQLYLISWVLAGFSIANAGYCFMKRKNYRMFDAKPNVSVFGICLTVDGAGDAECEESYS